MKILAESKLYQPGFWDVYEDGKACLCGRTFRTRLGRWFHKRFQGPLR